jgi:hypothetical protein
MTISFLGDRRSVSSACGISVIPTNNASRSDDVITESDKVAREETEEANEKSQTQNENKRAFTRDSVRHTTRPSRWSWKYQAQKHSVPDDDPKIERSKKRTRKNEDKDDDDVYYV